jgi:Acetoacetate decarboxylase (ADC)
VTAPVAPWALSGESLVALVACPGSLGELPTGLARVPGPVLVVAARYDDSPVGPYRELAIGEPARLGARPGWAFTTMAVDVPEARLGGRLNWGFPKELATLEWSSVDGEHRLRWSERDIVVRGAPGRVRVPVLMSLRALQRRNDGPVVIPSTLRGLGRFARLAVEAPDDDPLAPLTGRRHRGVHIASLKLTVRPARHPVGVASTLLAPLRAPEPALTLSTPGD